MAVINLLEEVIDVTKAPGGAFEVNKHDDGEIELNITRGIHGAMNREEECHRLYKNSRRMARTAHEKYSVAVKSIPTGFQAIARDLTHDPNQDAMRFARAQVINLASRFGESLNSLIQMLSKNENENKNKERRGYAIVFNAIKNIANATAQNDLKCKVIGLIERGITLVNMVIQYPNAAIKSKLELLAKEVKLFTIAQELSSTNNRPISVSLRSDSSDNELLKARLAQERLSQQEKRLDAYYANHVAAMEQMRLLTTNLANLNLSNIPFTEIINMVQEELKLFGELKKNWDDLVLSFSSFYDQVARDFRLKFESFFGTTDSTLDTKESAIDQKLFLQIIKDDLADLYHESYVLFVLSRTYYDVSSKYLMPRLSGLSSMSSSSNNNERQASLIKLQQDTAEVQTKIKELIDERRKKYQKIISKKRAKINEVIDHQGADGNEMDIIKQGEKLLEINN
jgi:hypothetical protein